MLVFDLLIAQSGEFACSACMCQKYAHSVGTNCVQTGKQGHMFEARR